MASSRIILHGPSQRDYACKRIRGAVRGAVVIIKKATRSNAQNALMWVWLNQIAKAQPEERKHSPEVWKAIFMQGFGAEIQFALDLDGRPFPLGHRTSKLSVDEMAGFLTFMEAEAATRWGIVLEGKEE